MKKHLLVSFLARKSLKKKNGMIPIYCRIRYDNGIAQFNTKIDIFSEEYLEKLKKLKLPNTKIKLLHKLLARAISEYTKINRVSEKRLFNTW